ncbi:hypothetical protein NPS70_11340 [Streptomyces sp. C10-9-1]|uniref:hypothetical protein n=1 Tax=Streptomyces sp. C10-9-1 TaxID=1859285 RepID=UPI0021135658|nr:hypothetical protein [Streptomyces sp. C10-9-1]MCQ6553783.1 hypothetical protein [Streptomyces sp. C10-9-1]
MFGFPGRRLQQGFAELGDLTGRTADEIIASVGAPISQSMMGPGQVLLQWQGDAYHIGILFEQGQFAGITSEDSGRLPGGRALARGFAGLGNLTGRTKDEIIAVVGPYSSFSVAGPHQVLLQWQSDVYHIALLFEGDECVGIAHEFAI